MDESVPFLLNLPTLLSFIHLKEEKKREAGKEGRGKGGKVLALVLLVARKLQNASLPTKQFLQSAGTSIFVMSLVYNPTPHSSHLPCLRLWPL